MSRPTFSIVTPSFRNSKWLKLCIASVADQGVSLEHIVQDAVSDDGTLDWLPQDMRVKAYIEKDKGMYDAVNRGFGRSQGEILAYINCDEQYLPGALQKVEKFFTENPDVDMVFGDVVIVNADGAFNCFRKVQIPWYHHTWVCSNLCTFTAATFMRRKVVEELHLTFDTKWRDLGDAEWMLRVIRKGIRMEMLKDYTSSFTETGANMNMLPNAIREKKEFLDAAPAWARKIAPVLRAAHRARRLLQGAYSQSPFDYRIFTLNSPSERALFRVQSPTSRWVR